MPQQQSQIAEWTTFKVGPPRNNPLHPDWDNPDCQFLNAVYHVTHIYPALQILANGRIKADLVFDKSKLNTKRILVTWISPNDWTNAGGFRYGNVRFQFEWTKLIQGMNYYWVESIAYGIKACRILVTDENYSRKLDRYDPTIGDGPWWYDTANNQHYWNGQHCLEIMLGRSLELDECERIDFVKHHPKFCNVDYRTCQFLGLGSYKASALFVAGIIAQEIDPRPLKLTEERMGRIFPGGILQLASTRIKEDIRQANINYVGNLTQRDNTALSLIRPLFRAYALSKDGDLHNLASLFASQDELLNICTQVINDTFGIVESDDF